MSNTDPIGTQGARPPVSDLELALSGGDGFAERMRQLSSAKADVETALQNLNLGKGVRAAHVEAQQTVVTAVAESNTLKLQAEATLASAQTQASNIIETANATASQILSRARSNAAAVKADAASTKQDAETYALQTKNAADSAHAAAVAHEQAVQQARTEAESVLASHKAALTFTEAAKADADQTRITLQAKIDRLHGVLREITG
jgi:hypothetical protein